MESGVDVLFDEDEGELLNWKVSDGSYVKPAGVILTYRTANDERKQLKANAEGVVTVDATVKKGKVMLV